MSKKSKWVRCSLCRKQTKTKIYPNTVLIRFPLYCQECEKEIPVTIINHEMIICKEIV